MKISYRWLTQYVKTKLPPTKLAEVLTMSGTEVTGVEEKASDVIFDLEVTSNRPDCLSVIGIAREIAAVTGSALIVPHATVRQVSGADRLGHQAIKVLVEDKRLCPRYTARVIRGVRVGPSPRWLVERLESVGLRSVNAVVDVTNFCLLEMGEPMHAFDLDRLAGAEVHVRKARPGEKITTIDKTERALEESMLVIADGKRPVAVAGVMGGLDSEVTGATKNILLEAAIFDPISVRRTSRTLGLSSESSYRFERRIDPAVVTKASDRATALIGELAGGTVGPFYDTAPKPVKDRTVLVRVARANDILGVSLTPQKMKTLLSGLGLGVSVVSSKTLKVVVRPFRADLQSEIDIIEEIARLYGYQNIPTTVPAIFEQPMRIPPQTAFERAIRDSLTALGLDEIITYSLVSRKVLEAASLFDGTTATIANPLSSEQECMRPSLLPGALQTVLSNINKANKDVSLFELGNVCARKGDAVGFSERLRLGIVMTGRRAASWLDEKRQVDIFDIKGVIEELSAKLKIQDMTFSPGRMPLCAASSCASVTVAGEPAGHIGIISEDLVRAFDIKQSVVFAELDVETLGRWAKTERRYERPPVYPSVFRDISLVVDAGVANAQITALVRREGKDLVKDVQPFDAYSGSQIPEGKKGVTYRVEYQDAARTLEDAQVNASHARICEALTKELGATIR